MPFFFPLQQSHKSSVDYSLLGFKSFELLELTFCKIHDVNYSVRIPHLLRFVVRKVFGVLLASVYTLATRQLCFYLSEEWVYVTLTLRVDLHSAKYHPPSLPLLQCNF